ncbi:hydrolase 2, exosortase A system-associated [Pelomonas sp. V22]|uniref:hydrolase 2, exosortase A system-associated n=1 Tax=Pelomonas sp. V22 TaxID=2822139 RepID=UPI0024A960A6|nr:hydrolase 2, exosortase A system-associated [Pelomonas sp. V22]MDI4631685.1 hydrolase 2, exosortase A system-associated [Pelomonas sp. V22]
MVEAFFLEAPDGGQRYCLFHSSTAAPRALLLYIPPFAEELNKTRRMAALQSRALAEAGIAVLQIDLKGCGDSSGDFGDASWQAWLDDITLARQWLQARHPGLPLWLWGLRAGCLLASAAAQAQPGVAGQLWWQPPASGKLLAQQWLRLKAAGEMLGGGANAAKGAMDQLRQQLAAGEAVEIAGYTCAASLILGLEAATLQAPGPQALIWLELSRDAEAPALTPVATKQIDAWRAAGTPLTAEAVSGPAFWATTEIEEAPLLLQATRRLLLEALS